MIGTRTGGAALAAAAMLLLQACGGAPSGPNLKAILSGTPPERLSEFGLGLQNGGPGPGSPLVAYDLVNPLFSDHAAKHRQVYVPEGKQAAYSKEGVFEFPVGTVLVKTFAFAPDMRTPDVGERYIETRLLIRQQAGWVAWPYVWNEDQTEAVYAPVGARRPIETVSPSGEALSIAYQVPNQNQCKTCHQHSKSMTPIGPTARNLNHPGPSGSGQLADWSARGILSGAPDPSAAPAAPHVDDESKPLEDRARAWLDINCAHCHSAGGSASNSGLFLRWDETSPTGWGVRKRPVAAGRGSGDATYVIEPGAPDASILVHRLESVEPGVVMPELGRTVVNRHGLALVRRWIAEMPAAPN